MKKKPNIITIVSHDLGRHLCCYGQDTIQSPNLDALAANGVLFERAFCTAPQCSPSRASLATGRYPHSNGVMGLTQGPFGWDLHEEEVILAQMLRGIGYRTVLGSYQHFTHRTLQEIGFEEHAHCRGAAEDVSRGFGDWLRKNSNHDRPLYAHLAYSEPHRTQIACDFGHAWDSEKGVAVPPWLADEPTAREEFAAFQGGIRGLDRGIGILVEELRANDMLDNTILVFMADHGIPFPRAKCSLYDPGLEIALIVHWPEGIVRAGRRVEPMVSNVDVLPTLLELLKIEVPPAVQGRSFLSILRDEPFAPRKEIFGEMTYHGYCDPVRCIRTETHKLIINFTVAPSFMDSSQSWRPKTITRVPADPEFAYHPPIELYDLRSDPLEQMNIAYTEDSVPFAGGGMVALSDDPAVVTVRDDLLRRLHRWMTETEDPLLDGIPTPKRHRDVVQLMDDAEGMK